MSAATTAASTICPLIARNLVTLDDEIAKLNDEKPTPEKILKAIERYHVTYMLMVPTVLYGILDSADLKRRDISSLQTLLYGGSTKRDDFRWGEDFLWRGLGLA